MPAFWHRPQVDTGLFQNNNAYSGYARGNIYPPITDAVADQDWVIQFLSEISISLTEHNPSSAFSPPPTSAQLVTTKDDPDGDFA